MLDIHQIKAVFWDFDGVILDTEPLHHAAFNDVLNPLGIHLPWSTYRSEYIGYDDRDALKHAAKSHDVDLDTDDLIPSKASAFQHQLSDTDMAPYPGVLALLEAWDNRGVPQVICSGALMGDIDPVLDAMQIRNRFKGFVTADRVTKSKPDPETYEKGFSMAASAVSGLRKEQCLVIEDTPTGITAAKKAQLPVLAVTNTHSREHLELADWVVDSLVGLLHS